MREYELLWRADGGREWHSLGRFKGNGDATTEVAHSLSSMRGGGLRARYLRVLPTAVEGGGAMRIGVYGIPTEAVRARTGNAGSAGGGGAEATVVTYTLVTPPATLNPRYSHVKWRYSERWDKERVKGERAKARSERRNYVNEWKRAASSRPA